MHGRGQSHFGFGSRIGNIIRDNQSPLFATLNRISPERRACDRRMTISHVLQDGANLGESRIIKYTFAITGTLETVRSSLCPCTLNSLAPLFGHVGETLESVARCRQSSSFILSYSRLENQMEFFRSRELYCYLLAVERCDINLDEQLIQVILVVENQPDRIIGPNLHFPHWQSVTIRRNFGTQPKRRPHTYDDYCTQRQISRPTRTILKPTHC